MFTHLSGLTALQSDIVLHGELSVCLCVCLSVCLSVRLSLCVSLQWTDSNYLTYGDVHVHSFSKKNRTPIRLVWYNFTNSQLLLYNCFYRAMLCIVRTMLSQDVRLSVRMSVRPSVTCRYSIETTKQKLAVRVCQVVAVVMKITWLVLNQLISFSVVNWQLNNVSLYQK